MKINVDKTVLLVSLPFWVSGLLIIAWRSDCWLAFGVFLIGFAAGIRRD